jgi:predicted ATP-binding protein involved in virulence
LSNETVQIPTSPPDISPAPPAYFLSLTVESFRCFGPAQTLDLSRGENQPAPWTIILGENGVGKTTLLQSLAAFQPDLEYAIPISTDRFYSIGATSLRKTQQRTTTSSFTMTCRIGDKLQSSSMRAVTGGIVFVGRQDGGSYEGQSLDRRGLICYGYGASRRMGKAVLSEQRTDDTTASLFSDDVDLINAEEWLLQADYAASKAPKSNTRAAQRRDQVIEILKALLPDVDDLRFSAAEKEISAPVVEFHTPYGWVRLKDLSLGYRTLLTWMVDLASRLFDRYPQSENPLAEPAVVLVDEIDLHLHPRWQRTLLRFLSDRFPNTQFIATAHSPLVVQAAEDANIVLLRREGDHVVIDNDVERIKNWRVDQILTSELFGLESARPPQVGPALAERQKILSKARLTKADEKRLTELEAQIGDLPTGETPDDWQAMDIIRRAAELLKS